MGRPSDGYAYNKIELEAIWQLPVELADIARGLERPFQFHTQCAAVFATSKPTEAKRDEDAIHVIERAISAEAVNPEPGEPPQCTCDKPKGFTV